MRNENAAEWDYAELWDKFPVPARPCPEELAIQEKEITKMQEGGRDLNLLILGSTIEYRSLAKKLGIVPHVADFSKENFDSLTAYSKEKFGEERFIQTDWLQISDKDKYDAVLGHRCFNCLRPKDVGRFFGRIYDSMKPGGVFFCRGNVLFPEDRDRLEEIRAKWAFNPEREHPLFSYLEVELYFRCADEEGYIDYPKARRVMDGWFAEGKISREDHELARLLVSMPAGTLFRGKVTKEEIDSHIQDSSFRDVEWLFTSQELSRNMPIIKLIKGDEK